jgi:hypothetical protein
MKGQTIEQVIRLLLLIVAYWLILTYPWAFRIYTRAVEGSLSSLSLSYYKRALSDQPTHT